MASVVEPSVGRGHNYTLHSPSNKAAPELADYLIKPRRGTTARVNVDTSLHLTSAENTYNCVILYDSARPPGLRKARMKF